MEWISKEDLENMLCSYDDSVTIAYITDKLLDACKELPTPQWQTIDEFKANPVDGWCHVSCGDKKELAMAFFEDGVFWYNDLFKGSNNFYHVKITNVMPIKTPEAPK